MFQQFQEQERRHTGLPRFPGLAVLHLEGTLPTRFSEISETLERKVRDISMSILLSPTLMFISGDGQTDDTTAINNAITFGNRCGLGCDSSTVTPALVYFPPGTYLVSAPLIQYYYTQFVGDAVSIPTLKAAPGFQGIAVIDSDPYANTGNNWYTNQNNFYRQVRNFVIDLTALDPSKGTGIHWQVAQATSLQNIRFEMIKGGANNKQQGIFMENGSGGWMSDLIFNGGYYGAFLGNQQFTTRNLTFNNVQTAIFMNFNWVWTFKSVTINSCVIGINMTSGNFNQSVGSILLQDSSFIATPIGIATAFNKAKNVPATGGTLIIDNVDFTGAKSAIVDLNSAQVLKGGSKIASWAQGNAYSTGSGLNSTQYSTKLKTGPASQVQLQGALTPPSKPAVLLNAQGAIFERSKPQYETVPLSSFISVKASGAKGDGVHDDTAAIQAVFNKATANSVVYFDHGAYLISSTVKVPKNIRITGEIWPLIMASGSAFSDQTKPAPVFQVGQPGDIGAVEMSDLVFETKGAQPGAILVEWNVAEPSAQMGASGMWDVHFRIGGTAGTELQSDKCTKNPTKIAPADPQCEGAFLLLHITKSASCYVENMWLWVADHELDLADHSQINIYNGRGMLVESRGPVWLYGTSSEHSQLYNYQLSNAMNVYMGCIQTETPYMQSNPDALSPFTPNSAYSDPTFSGCTTPSCKKAWGLRIVSSSSILVYGAGLYSFFDNYSQDCLATESCQENMVSVENCSGEVYIWGLSTKASTNMVSVNGQAAALQADNKNAFCQTIAVFENV